jgi:predicted secreted Zn-dependent protease
MPYGYLGYPPYRGQPRARRSRREWLGLFAILAVVLAILIIPTTLADIAAYQTVTRPDFPVAVNGATVTYYDITGATAQALADAMHTEGQTRCGATDAVACLSYGFDWTDQTTTSSAGVCKVTSVDLVPTYQMTLPRWVGPSLVPQGLVDWWRQVQAHLIWHESQHLAISQGYEPALRAAITAGPCDDTPNSPSAAVLAVKAALEVDQSQFDISDRGWTWPAYTGP